MAKHLVIVESPAKAKTINKFLGKDYVVKASMGHVRDLPESKLGVDPEKGFEPHYVNSKDKAKVIKELKDAAKKCGDVILAPDPDREGEAIAWHLREVLRKEMPDDASFQRVTYNQITKPAILKAFSEPGAIDLHKVDAQQARRVLDRLVGYQVSPLLWRRIRGGSSAGRVQTVALRLVCEREKEVLAFVPETFWIFGATVAKEEEPKTPFALRMLRAGLEKGEVRDAELADAIQRDLEGKSLVVSQIQQKETQRRPQPPFITSTLQQAASSAYGFQPNRTMSLAQKLYEGVDLGDGEGAQGLITYMRTDSVYLAQEAIQETRDVIAASFGAEYLPEKPNFYRSRGNAQEAHEAIRPTDPRRNPDSLRGVLDEAELKLYTLIWNRLLACQMMPARIAQLSVDVVPQGTEREYLFRASASKVIFPGYMRVWGREVSEDEEEGDSELPPLREGEPLRCLEWLREQKQTQPPKRFSEAALIRQLEENGVGRPSTYASIVSTLYSREYVERESRSLRPTKAGMEVHDFLVGRLPELFEVDFTARMEEKLDAVEEGTVHWTDMMKDFYDRFVVWVEEAKTGKVDLGEVAELLDLAAEVKSFAPPVKRGKKTYSDETFSSEIREALAAKKAITDRQVDNLRKVVARYRPQIPSLDDGTAKRLNLTELIVKEAEANQPPRPSTLRKLEILEKIEFGPARKIGKKVYDDSVFAGSLREQVMGGKRLSENQIVYLDKLVKKYMGQIPDAETLLPQLDIHMGEEVDHESGPLLELLAKVTTWAEPTVRGDKTWDDREFYESLKGQFEGRKNLSPRQRAAMKKMVARYHEQIPDYAEKKEALGLYAPRAPKAEGESAPRKAYKGGKKKSYRKKAK